MIDFTITRGKGGVIAWSEEQVAYIIEEYTKNNISLTELGKRFGVSYEPIRRVLNNNKIKQDKNHRGYPRKSDYFSTIDSKDKAYWLGLLYADGSISKEDRHEIRLELIDKEHIEKFKKALQANNHNIGCRKDTRFENAKNSYYLSLKDKQLWTDLVKLGCCNNKTFLIDKIPNIPKDFIIDFIRGYFDGDGSIHFLNNGRRYRISFSGTKKFLENIRYELHMENYGSISKVNNNENCYQLQIAGRKQVKEILDKMYYSTNDSMRLNRKYQKYLEFLRCFTTELAHTRCE